MSANIITYWSKNADPKQQWMGFIETSKGRLGIWFPGETEEEVKGKVREFWKTEQEKKAADEARIAAAKKPRPTKSESAP